jgi:hypothetical protein
MTLGQVKIVLQLIKNISVANIFLVKKRSYMSMSKDH